MTEFHIIGTGNIYEFVIKDIDNPRTYGRFGACGDDRKSMQEFVDYVNQLIKENEQLKTERDRYKRLSEIRQETINNRILTIKEFIDNCSDKEVKKTLGQLFYSEVKEYDLSKKIRKLEKENEQLKKDKDDLIAFIKKEFPKTHKYILEGFE